MISSLSHQKKEESSLDRCESSRGRFDVTRNKGHRRRSSSLEKSISLTERSKKGHIRQRSASSILNQCLSQNQESRLPEQDSEGEQRWDSVYSMINQCSGSPRSPRRKEFLHRNAKHLSDAEYMVMMQLKRLLERNGGFRAVDWLRSRQLTSWSGVSTVVDEDGRISVAKLNFDFWNLTLSLGDHLGGMLSKLSKLTELDLRFNRGITGPVDEILSCLPNLKKLGLSGTEVTGSLTQIANTGAALEVLWLTNTRISGSLLELSRIGPNLKELSLNNTDVSGVLSELKFIAPVLEKLGLRCTKVQGSLNEILIFAPKVQVLTLNGSIGITGNLMDIIEIASQLEVLLVAGTSVDLVTADEKGRFLARSQKMNDLEVDIKDPVAAAAETWRQRCELAESEITALKSQLHNLQQKNIHQSSGSEFPGKVNNDQLEYQSEADLVKEREHRGSVTGTWIERVGLPDSTPRLIRRKGRLEAEENESNIVSNLAKKVVLNVFREVGVESSGTKESDSKFNAHMARVATNMNNTSKINGNLHETREIFEGLLEVSDDENESGNMSRSCSTNSLMTRSCSTNSLKAPCPVDPAQKERDVVTRWEERLEIENDIDSVESMQITVMDDYPNRPMPIVPRKILACQPMTLLYTCFCNGD
uniref:Uncharacterized protein n=1 Tax=Octactis speculum TaxID=3111310 RepID=A0A7S2FYA1_9STRA|mmetsp:Transcript_33606/g.45422  ORF Transcript_33606/g.45422 Transcript_33606/m.45422 type:complete len:647 (+) Transcript_33606:52-1992(+)